MGKGRQGREYQDRLIAGAKTFCRRTQHRAIDRLSDGRYIRGWEKAACDFLSQRDSLPSRQRPPTLNSIRRGAAVFGMLLAQLVFAQAYPTARTVSLVVAFPVGGGTDIVARMIADKMREALKANVVVDNKPGASAQIGTKFVTDAA